MELPEFLIGRYPVTVAEYARFIEDDGYKKEQWWAAGSFGRWSEPDEWAEQCEYPSRPVTGVSWFEATAYAAWSGGRLPTEAEWERAARGTDGRSYPWGNDPVSAERLNFYSDVGQPTPVGIYPTGGSPGGIQDMAGNVWEWCWDWFGKDYYRSSPDKDPRGPGEGHDRVVRGGSWIGSARRARSACRIWYQPDDRSNDLGFRVVVGVARTR